MNDEFITLDNENHFEKIKTDHGFVYKPKNNENAIAQNATLGVKFSNDIFLMKSFLDQKGIEYKEEELDDSPLGKGIRIKRN